MPVSEQAAEEPHLYCSAPEEALSTAIVEALSTVTGTPVSERPPLYAIIEPDALDAFIASLEHGLVSFTYANCRVTVEEQGIVFVESIEADKDQP
ncbi:HalOD1 output domain-containing protein [Halomarina halobia]|uniref:HalOD1 output domain-containing protein n=1 Tax=Halomarina halobia TaxID=3033386 RepID=A0ABD6AEM2_9EURY|nr:HalOD1 output domain-containing protein [Halomarina sp. PSR21]